MGRYTKLAADAFQKISANAGVLLKKFDVDTGVVDLADIWGATSGGSTFQATPQFRDRSEGIDNAVPNMKEMKELTGWEVTFNTTFVSMDAALTKALMGCGDIDGSKIVPRSVLRQSDFLDDFWIVCDYSEDNTEETGKAYAIHMLNVLSTGGFQMKTNDKNNNTFAGVFTAHPTMADQTKVPFEVYILDGAAE